MDDLMVDFTHKSYPVPLKYYSFGLPKIYKDIGMSIKDTKKYKRLVKLKNTYKTIADPMNPVFRYDGTSISKFLYNKRLDEHYKDFLIANITIDSREKLLKSKFVECSNIKPKLNSSIKFMEKNLEKKKDESSELQTDSKENYKENLMTKKELTKANQKAFRRSLSLPLKPLTCETTENTMHSSIVKNKIVFTKTPTTPLTTKLGLLAFEEQKLDVKTLPTPCETRIKNFLSNQNAASGNDKNETVVCNLLSFVHQNMTIMLILEDGLEKNQDLIQSLWEIGAASLKKVEHLNNKSLANISVTSTGSHLKNNNIYNICHNNNNDDKNASYSFLSLDSHWGATQRSGSWSDEELRIVGSLNNDLTKFSNITEIIIRNENSVIYGYSCGGTTIFYQQGGCSGAGLPTPADLMGMVTLKARKRLERDRDVVLL